MIKNTSDSSRRMSHYLKTLAGIMGLALLTTLFFFNENYEGFRDFIVIYIWGVVVVATQWLGHSYIYGLLDKKYSWQDHLVKRAIFQILAIIAYSATAYMVVMVIMYMIVVGSLPENPVSWGLRSSYIAILVSFTVSLIFVAVAFFTNWRKAQLEAERFKSEMLMYKYEALQNQINPHFLFNSFNVLSELVYEDQKKAVRFITQLSQLFRYVLDSREKELVPVREELEFIQAYIYLLQTRFEDKLTIELDFTAMEEEMIVPMTLQLLIENCVKHNEISASQPLSIRILRKEDYIKVENTLQPLPMGAESKKTGLSNISQQYKYFTDKGIFITETDHSYAVAVPLIQSERK